MNARRRIIVGARDTVWIVFVVASAALLVGLLVGHLRVQFDTYRLANERASLLRERRTLNEEHRRLQIELQVRSDSFDLEGVARDRLGMRPVTPEQIVEVPRRRIP